MFLMPTPSARTLTALASSSALWQLDGSAATFTGADIDITSTDDAIYSDATYNAANWPMTYSYSLDTTPDNSSACSGLFDDAETATFIGQSAGGEGNLNSMSKSWGIRHSDGVCLFGSGASPGTLSGGGVVSGNVIKWVIAADGTVTIEVNDVQEFTFGASKANGILIRWMHGASNANKTFVNCTWSYYV
jgi:hypothetical protein